MAYDLRPLVLGLEVGPATGPSDGVPLSAVVRMRLRHGQEGGAGRPDEVVLALGEHVRRDLIVASAIRERLLTSHQLPPG